MIYCYKINGLPLQTGDLICTADGPVSIKNARGLLWRLLGKLVPGAVDHVIIFLGPGGRCIEAGPKGVITFEALPSWDTELMCQRRGILDTLYGIAYPMYGQLIYTDKIREAVAEYCLGQVGKDYNPNIFNALTEHAFYCSQLAFRAYSKYHISITKTVIGIVFPQGIWDDCYHRRAA